MRFTFDSYSETPCRVNKQTNMNTEMTKRQEYEKRDHFPTMKMK